jgi:hypothetical protein
MANTDSIKNHEMRTHCAETLVYDCSIRVGYDELTHLEVIRLLDLGRGGVGADLQDVVVRAVLHHTGSAHNRTPTTDVATRRGGLRDRFLAGGKERVETRKSRGAPESVRSAMRKKAKSGSLTRVRRLPGGGLVHSGPRFNGARSFTRVRGSIFLKKTQGWTQSHLALEGGSVHYFKWLTLSKVSCLI